MKCNLNSLPVKVLQSNGSGRGEMFMFMWSSIHLQTVILMQCVLLLLTVFDHLYKISLLVVPVSCELVRMKILHGNRVPPTASVL
jgi:hypothetical protein